MTICTSLPGVLRQMMRGSTRPAASAASTASVFVRFAIGVPVCYPLEYAQLFLVGDLRFDFGAGQFGVYEGGRGNCHAIPALIANSFVPHDAQHVLQRVLAGCGYFPPKL